MLSLAERSKSRHVVQVVTRTSIHPDLRRTFRIERRALRYERQLKRAGLPARTLTIHPR